MRRFSFGGAACDNRALRQMGPATLIVSDNGYVCQLVIGLGVYMMVIGERCIWQCQWVCGEPQVLVNKDVLHWVQFQVNVVDSTQSDVISLIYPEVMRCPAHRV